MPVIRPARLDDIAAIRSILAAHDSDGPIVNGDIVGPYVRHLITRGRTVVALDGDDVVGFGATIDAGRAVHLADLFVRPDLVGQGTGRRLLDAVFGDAVERTTFASDDPRALPLYVRAGMLPLAISLYVEGESARLPRNPSVRTRTATADELAAIENGWTGHDQTADYRFWTAQAAADAFAVVDGDEVVAIGNARARQNGPVRVLDRLVVNPDAAVDPIPATLAAIERAGRGGLTRTSILGPSPVLRQLLEHGFRIVEHDQCMATDPNIVDPTRLIPNPGLL